MDVAALLLELHGRLPHLAREAVRDLDLDELTRPPGPGANTIAWLVWHIAREQDAQVPVLFGTEQEWVAGDWGPRFGVPSDPANHGYGHGPEDMAAIRPTDPSVLIEYLDVVFAQVAGHLGGVQAGDLDRVVDEAWDPPVTLGVRLVSVIEDAYQHVGQAAYVRGLLLKG